MTIDGPQPLGYRESPIDYNHYVEKQLEPVADAVLIHLGTSFRAILGGEKQMELF
jgi:DNA polymerase-2